MRVVHVLRKPCSEGTVAANVLRWGTGALNIDATRVAHDASVDINAVQRQQATGGNSSVKGAFGAEALVGKEIAMYKPGGRWPANLVLQHLDGCRQEGTKEIRVVGCTAHKAHHQTHSWAVAGTQSHDHPGYRNADGKETVAAWTCEPGCPVAALDEQSGGAEVGASRFFKQFSNKAKE